MFNTIKELNIIEYMSTSGETITTKVVKENNKRKFLVIDNEDTVEYIITVEINKKGREVYKLFYSKSDIWTEQTKGKLRVKMTNTGNGMKIKMVERGDFSEVDYSELEALRLLLLFETDNAQESSHKFVEV
jgi:hypothetical protein